MRKIIIDNKKYMFKVGKSNIVIKHDNKSTIIDLSSFTNLPWDVIERARWKGYFSITPKDVETYIRRNNEDYN
jgi:hypothetical protein